jgi:hypothetical protein
MEDCRGRHGRPDGVALWCCARTVASLDEMRTDLGVNVAALLFLSAANRAHTWLRCGRAVLLLVAAAARTATNKSNTGA